MDYLIGGNDVSNLEKEIKQAQEDLKKANSD
jgi:hypothetical protein